MNQASTRQFGLLEVGIGALTMATALMHFFLVFPSLLFMLNGVGYVVLLAALYLPIAQLAPYRRQIRWALMAYTAVTIVIGFSILALSNFIPSVYFGLLTSLVMFIAILSALTLLPQLLILSKPFGKESNVLQK